MMSATTIEMSTRRWSWSVRGAADRVDVIWEQGLLRARDLLPATSIMRVWGPKSYKQCRRARG